MGIRDRSAYNLGVAEIYTTPASLAELDRRATDYRYDLEADIRWAELAAPGALVPPSVLATLGADVAGIEASGQAELYDWCFGLLICQHFIELERVVIKWVKGNPALAPSQSLEWLRDEEIKHIQTFRRFRQHLLEQRPQDAEQAQALLHELHPPGHFQPEGDGDLLGLHYWTWITILAFEEYTVHLYTALQAAPETVQPAWLDVHRCHAQEEVCHVETDATYVKSLQISAEDLEARSKLFVSWLMASYTKTFRVPAQMLLRLRPALQGQVSLGKPPKGFLDALLSSPDFAQTRACAPYLGWLAERKR